MPQRAVAALRSQTVRQTNLAVVLDHLRRSGPLSRSALVVATGLTRSAIGRLVRELVDLGLCVEDAALSDGSPGRPSPVVRVDHSRFGVLAVEIGVDELIAAVVALDGSIKRVSRIARSRERGEYPEVIADVAGLIAELGCGDRRVDGLQVLAVGAAIPALVGADGRVAAAPNLGWHDADLAAAIAEAIALEIPVFVGNDADLGALAEFTFGVRADHMVYVSGEVGVGGSVIAGGVRITGRSGFAGEFGHMPVNPAGRRCSCGATGCWETEVGERALLRRAGLDIDGGVPAVDELMERASAQDPVALAALAAEGRWLGVGIAGLINAFDPDVVVLGALLDRVLPSVRESLEAELASRRIHGLDRAVPVVGATAGRDATLLGAAELAFAAVLTDPTTVQGS
jgi:predicted NBD/HSP70 family sugar kinase